MGGLYRLFNATMMMGVALLLDPNSPEAPEYSHRLDEFIEQHRVSDYPDLCSKREVRIIELFRTKARDPSWCAATATGSKRGNTAKAASTQDAARQSSRPRPPVSAIRTTGGDEEACVLPPATTPSAPGWGGTPDNGSSTSSHDHTADLAQSIFDQLRGSENFGLYRPPVGGAEEDGLGQGMTLDSMSGGIEDLFLDLWTPGGSGAGLGTGAMMMPSNPGPSADAIAAAAAGFAPGSADPSALTLNNAHSLPAVYPASSAGPDANRPGASGSGPASAPAAPSAPPPPLSPKTKGEDAERSASTSVPPTEPPSRARRTLSSDSGSKDSALLPWGGLIEAIHSSTSQPSPSHKKTRK